MFENSTPFYHPFSKIVSFLVWWAPRFISDRFLVASLLKLISLCADPHRCRQNDLLWYPRIYNAPMLKSQYSVQ